MDPDLNDEQRMLRESIRGLSDRYFRPQAAVWDSEARAPREHVGVLAQHGFTGICIPEEYGGVGGSLLDLVIVVEEISRACANTAILMSTTDGSTARAIGRLGTEEQKQTYLPRFARAELLAAWAMSEAEAGSDVGSIRTRAVRDGDELVIDGAKLWCTCAQVADLFLVFARLDDREGLAGVGAVLVERDSPGLSVGRHLDLLGLRGTGMAEVVLEGCRAPVGNVLVGAGEMGRLLRVFDEDRIATNPPICLGVSSRALDIVVEHLRTRKQFKRALADFQGLRWRVADMAIDVEATRALLYRAAARMDAGIGTAKDAAIAKTHANEMSMRVTNGAIQMLGALGLSQEVPLERMLRDVRGLALGYGTTEIQRNNIAREIFR